MKGHDICKDSILYIRENLTCKNDIYSKLSAVVCSMYQTDELQISNCPKLKRIDKSQVN